MHYKKGFEFYVKNKFEDAAKEYKTAVKYNSGNTSAALEYRKLADDLSQKYYEFGMSLYGKGDFVKAKEYLRTVLTYKPDKMEAKRALEKYNNDNIFTLTNIIKIAKMQTKRIRLYLKAGSTVKKFIKY
ncbi:MAG: hypothetical protein LBS81_01055 [Endomicrobium sp.]|jgi:tetratricopeptide (TPR) repeat protein|nr:hypothetical protein [Endomicrobium sp.]